MSFDIVVLRVDETEGRLPSLEDVDQVLPLGNREEVRARCDAVFPGIKWSTEVFGLYQADTGYAIEISIPDAPQPTSLHLCLFFGQAWEGAASSSFDHAIQRLYALHQWQAFAASDNSSLLLAEEE
jgi:hypothetical protein